MKVTCGTGTDNVIEAPVGNVTVSVVGDGQLAIALELVVGIFCCDATIASCRRHFTSSAVANSRAVWPSWFFMYGSAPCAKSNAQS